MRRIVICLDGTWNVREHTTNVWRLYALAIPSESGSDLKYYAQGIGTRWYDKVTGGAFGRGMYRDVRDAYVWLAERYRPGDQLYIFGFSRGAATALSLTNLIDRCGIVGASSASSFEEAYRLYSLPGFTRDSPASVAYRQDSEDQGQECTLKFIGLFDTVASLWLRRLWSEDMHVLTLPSSAGRVAHAIAIDECRRMFQPVMFPEAPIHGSLTERWFSGAHANVGGGYSKDPIALLPLRWMISEAARCGLEFRRVPKDDVTAALDAEERDSFQEFAGGALMLIPYLTRKARQIRRRVRGDAEEVVDASAVMRFRDVSSYRANSLPLKALFNSELPEAADFRVVQRGDMEMFKKNDARVPGEDFSLDGGEHPLVTRNLAAQEISLIELYQRQDAISSQLWQQFVISHIATLAVIALTLVSSKESENVPASLKIAVLAVIFVVWAIFCYGNLTGLMRSQAILRRIAHQIQREIANNIVLFTDSARKPSGVRVFHLAVDAGIGVLGMLLAFWLT